MLYENIDVAIVIKNSLKLSPETNLWLASNSNRIERNEVGKLFMFYNYNWDMFENECVLRFYNELTEEMLPDFLIVLAVLDHQEEDSRDGEWTDSPWSIETVTKHSIECSLREVL